MDETNSCLRHILNSYLCVQNNEKFQIDETPLWNDNWACTSYSGNVYNKIEGT